MVMIRALLLLLLLLLLLIACLLLCPIGSSDRAESLHQVLNSRDSFLSITSRAGAVVIREPFLAGRPTCLPGGNGINNRARFLVVAISGCRANCRVLFFSSWCLIFFFWLVSRPPVLFLACQ
jgi:hypothetical protein